MAQGLPAKKTIPSIMRNIDTPVSSIIPVPHKSALNDWKSDLTLCKRARLLKAATATAKHYYLNRSHQESGLLSEGTTITLRSRKFTYSWMIKGFTPCNTFEIAKADNPAWALSFKINDAGFCLDSDPAKSEYPLMILEHSEGCFRGDLTNFNKEISDPFQHIYGTAGWDHKQLQWYWQTKPPREFAYNFLCSETLNQLLENEEVILFTIDRYNAQEEVYRISLYRPFDIKTIELSLNHPEIQEIALMTYPDKQLDKSHCDELGATG